MNKSCEAIIEECSKTEELTTREKIKFKDTSNAVRIDSETEKGSFIIVPDFYVVVKIYNEKAKDDKEYYNYVIVDKSGTMYVTGSEGFFNTFTDIHDDMSGEEYELEIMRKPSKNREGKFYLTCAIV